MASMYQLKARSIYLCTALAFAFLALLTRANIPMPELLSVYGGDTLWGVMLYFLICALIPKGVGIQNLVIALLVSYSVEASQLYQAEWILKVRANKAGGLLLGHGFLISDLVCYTIGNVSAFLLDIKIHSHFLKGKIHA